MNIKKIRTDFPILKSGITYFDSAATSLTPKPVVLAEMDYYENFNANIHRGVHELSQIASEHYESAYKKVAGFINSDSKEVIFTKNTTEGINLVARGLDFKKGDKIVTTEIEHHSNFLPWMWLKKKFNINLEVVKPDRLGEFDITDFEKAAKGAKLIACTHVSNVFGTIMPVREIGKIAKENNSMFLVDAAQSVPHLKVDVKKIGCDFLAFSGHKMLGPTGIGALYINRELINEIEPMQLGGGTVNDINSDFSDYNLVSPPGRFEAGTPPIAQAIGLGAAVDYINKIGINEIEKHGTKLTNLALNSLAEIEGVEIYGSKNRAGIISFNIKGLNPHAVAKVLSENKIMARSGYHCCIPVMRGLGIKDGTIRVSFYVYNTIDEVENFISIVRKIIN